MGRSLVLKPKVTHVRSHLKITALSYLMCDLENVSQRYLQSDTCKVTGVIVQEITIGMH